MRVPPAQIDGDETNARFDQTASEQQALAPGGHTTAIGSRRLEFGHEPVPLAHSPRFSIQVESLARFLACHEVPGFLMERISRLELAAIIDFAAKSIEGTHERTTIIQ